MALSEKAQIAKEKGNAAFKSGDYPTAIGHYSAAIVHDRKDPTLPLNRAAAYLKLGKNEDAERDCMTVLALSPSNVKAIFRRGQARLGMGKLDEAKADFEAAAKIEPGNQAVKDELENVRVLIQKKASKTTQLLGSSAAPDPRRRRVPIQIVETPQETPSISREATRAVQESSPVPPALAPVSSTTSATMGSPTPTPAPATSPKTFQDAKRAREETKPSTRVGGGIFRASGKNTLFNSKENSATSPPTTSSPNVKTFANLYEFTKAWGSPSSPAERFQLIKNIEPSTYPSLFKTSLEPSLLISIIQTFLDILTSESHSDAKNVVTRSMENLLHVPRISTITLFLSGAEKDVVKRVLEKLDDASLTDLWRSVLKC